MYPCDSANSETQRKFANVKSAKLQIRKVASSTKRNVALRQVGQSELDWFVTTRSSPGCAVHTQRAQHQRVRSRADSTQQLLLYLDLCSTKKKFNNCRRLMAWNGAWGTLYLQLPEQGVHVIIPEMHRGLEFCPASLSSVITAFVINSCVSHPPWIHTNTRRTIKWTTNSIIGLLILTPSRVVLVLDGFSTNISWPKSCHIAYSIVGVLYAVEWASKSGVLAERDGCASDLWSRRTCSINKLCNWIKRPVQVFVISWSNGNGLEFEMLPVYDSTP